MRYHLSLCAAVGFAGALAAADPLPKPLAPYFTPPAEFAGQTGGYRSPLRFADGSEVKTADDWKRRRQEILKEWNALMGSWPEPIEKSRNNSLPTQARDVLEHNVAVN